MTDYEEHRAAAHLMNELDSSACAVYEHAPYDHYHCAACGGSIATGEAFPDDAQWCPGDDCECVVHRACLISPRGGKLRCPHCALLDAARLLGPL